MYTYLIKAMLDVEINFPVACSVEGLSFVIVVA